MIPRLALAPDYEISRLIKGGWHLAGGHGDVDPSQATRDMARFVDAGITTFDCADIYTGVEELIGRFRREYPGHARRLRVPTKFVPDLDRLATLDAAYVAGIIDRRWRGSASSRLDLVQFHWWDYATPRYVEVAVQLERLRSAGKIDRIGLTNFGTPQVRELCEAGVPVFAHQLQYSLLDDRPAHGMVELCAAQASHCCATARWRAASCRTAALGVAEPAGPLANRSLTKYRLIIDEFGGWGLFQELLRALRAVADRHACDVATVATRMVLDLPGVAAAIVGATSAAHLDAHGAIGDLSLTAADQAQIAAVTARRRARPATSTRSSATATGRTAAS